MLIGDVNYHLSAYFFNLSLLFINKLLFCMKKSEIEKRKLANRLRKKINESKKDIEEKVILSNGKDAYALNESELKSLIKEAVGNVLKRRNLQEAIFNNSDDEDLRDFNTFTPNRSYRHPTDDNFMGGVDPSDDEFDEYGNSREEGPDYDDAPVEPWKPSDLGDYDDYTVNPHIYNNALQKQQKANQMVDKKFRNSGKAFGNDEFHHTFYRGTGALTSKDYQNGFDNLYNDTHKHYSFDDDDYSDFDDEGNPKDWESGWNEDDY